MTPHAQAAALLVVFRPASLPYELTEFLGLTDAECSDLGRRTPYGFGSIRDAFPTPREAAKRMRLRLPPVERLPLSVLQNI